ncbi:MAG: hypothetical protein EXS63_01865 [Candidatus Omnitrophica bacterium]|nr:hypothetical protein [Candidatus Omnitrophota bacterium]
MSLRTNLSTLTLFLVCSLSAFAAVPKSSSSISVKAEVDHAFITIGDPVTYSVTIKHAADVLVLSTLNPPSEETFKLKNMQEIHRKEGALTVEGRKYTLTCLRLGEFILDPQEIQYRAGGGEVKTIRTEKIYVTVKSVAEGEEKKDIRGIKSVVRLEISLIPWIITGIVLLICVVGFMIYQKIKKSKGQPPKPETRLSLEEQALLDLDQLYDSDFLRNGKIKEYHLRLSEILRVYFEHRYDILAAESTTSEISHLLRQKNMDLKLREKIETVLEAADLAKFAKWKPDPQMIKENFKKAKEIVEDSKVVPIQEGGAA